MTQPTPQQPNLRPDHSYTRKGMKTQAPAATIVAASKTYTGPLGRFLQKQAEVKAAAHTATLRSMRANIMEMMIEPLFSPAERLRANDSVYQTTCVAQLQTWFRNVYRVYTERAAALCMTFEDGSRCFLPVAQPAAALFMWIA